MVGFPALIAGLPLGYLVWFPLGFSKLPFWEGFLLLFSLGWVVIVTVTLITRPENIETLENFYKLCKPPGLWKPVTEKYSVIEKTKIRIETWNDVVDSILSMICFASIIYVIISLFDKNYIVFIFSFVIFTATTITFVYRWKQKGIFTGLGSDLEI